MGMDGLEVVFGSSWVVAVESLMLHLHSKNGVSTVYLLRSPTGW